MTLNVRPMYEYRYHRKPRGYDCDISPVCSEILAPSIIYSRSKHTRRPAIELETVPNTRQNVEGIRN